MPVFVKKIELLACLRGLDLGKAQQFYPVTKGIKK